MHLCFSEIGVPPGTTEKILTEPEKYWKIHRNNGKVFYEPVAELRKIHEKIAKLLSSFWFYHSAATAYRNHSSIISNVERHKRNRSSLRLDVRHAFESIQTKHLYRLLLREKVMTYGPHDDYRFDRAQAWIVSRLLTCRGRLRRGSPAAPHVFNLMYRRLDKALLEKLKAFEGVVYTRYADDLCFSSPEDVFPKEAELAIRQVLREHYVVLKEKKTCRCKNGVLEFPGVVIVRGKVRPRGTYIAMVAEKSKSFSEAERRGHRDFLNQFGRGGIPRTLKALLKN
jgi:hypothetical protein